MLFLFDFRSHLPVLRNHFGGLGHHRGCWELGMCKASECPTCCTINLGPMFPPLSPFLFPFVVGFDVLMTGGCTYALPFNFLVELLLATVLMEGCTVVTTVLTKLALIVEVHILWLWCLLSAHQGLHFWLQYSCTGYSAHWGSYPFLWSFQIPGCGVARSSL